MRGRAATAVGGAAATFAVGRAAGAGAAIAERA
jgi:hypothetical protein